MKHTLNCSTHFRHLNWGSIDQLKLLIRDNRHMQKKNLFIFYLFTLQYTNINFALVLDSIIVSVLGICKKETVLYTEKRDVALSRHWSTKHSLNQVHRFSFSFSLRTHNW